MCKSPIEIIIIYPHPPPFLSFNLVPYPFSPREKGMYGVLLNHKRNNPHYS